MVSESAAWRLIWLYADPRFYFIALYRWMRIERVQRASAQFENLNGPLGPALDLQAVLAWTRSIRIQQDGAWKGIGGVIIGMLVSVPQTR